MSCIEATCFAYGSPRVIPIMQDTMSGPGLTGQEREDWEVLTGSLVGENNPDRHRRACSYERIESTDIMPPV